MVEFVYKRRHVLRLGGLALLVAALCIGIAFDEVGGLVLMGVAALVLLPVQPQLLAHLRSRQARRRAPQNGHGAGADADDFDLPRR
jgi:hypothetical protein